MALPGVCATVERGRLLLRTVSARRRSSRSREPEPHARTGRFASRAGPLVAAKLIGEVARLQEVETNFSRMTASLSDSVGQVAESAENVSAASEHIGTGTDR